MLFFLGRLFRTWRRITARLISSASDCRFATRFRPRSPRSVALFARAEVMDWLVSLSAVPSGSRASVFSYTPFSVFVWVPWLAAQEWKKLYANVQSVQLTNVETVSDYKDAIEDTQVAEQDILQAEYEVW